MFKPKIPKCEQPRKGNYLLYNSIAPPDIGRKITFKIVSIDPAKKNIGFRIEERNFCNHHIKTIVWDKKNLVDDDAPQSDLFYLRLVLYLEQFDHEVKDADLIIFERQLSINSQSLSVSYSILSYYLSKFPHIPIADVDPHLKGWMLGAPKGLNKYGLKQWAVEAAYDLLMTRRDEVGLAIMNGFKKKKQKLDDLADSLIMIEALCILWGYPKTTVPQAKLILKVENE